MAEDDLLFRVGADLSGLERDLAQMARAGQTFAQEFARSVSGVKIDAPLVDIAKVRAGGIAAGQALAGGITSELRDVAPAFARLRSEIATLRSLAGELRLGGASGEDISTLLAFTAETKALAASTAGANTSVLALDAALHEMREASVSGGTGLAAVERLLGDVEQAARRVASLPSIGTTLAGLTGAAVGGGAGTGAATRALEEERAARAQVAAELTREISLLGLRTRTLDLSSETAVAGFREELAQMRQQATELGLVREQMLRLDAAAQQFERHVTTAMRATRPDAGGLGSLVRTSGEFSALGNRVANTAVAVAFGLESVAASAGHADAGLKTALRSVAALGPAFGTPGLIVSGVAAATAALVDLAGQSSTSEQVARRFASELAEVKRQAGDAAAEVRNLSAAQASVRKLTLTTELAEATKNAKDLKREIIESLTPGRFSGLTDVFRHAGDEGNAFREMRSLLQGAREQFDAGTLDAGKFQQAVARIGLSSPALNKVTTELLDQVRVFGIADEQAKQLRSALSVLPSQTHIAGTPFDSGLKEQIADARELAAAYRAGGDTARDATGIALGAFREWRAQQHDVTLSHLSFRDALRSADPEVRGMALAIQRDAAEMARLNSAAREAKTELRDVEAIMRAFADRVQARGGLQLTITPTIDVQAMRQEVARSTQLLTSKLAAVPLTLDVTQVRGGLGELETALRSVRDAQTDLGFAKIFGGDASIRGAADQLRDAQVAAREAARAVLPFILSIKDPALRQGFLDRFRADLQDVGELAPRVDRLNVALRGSGTAVRGVLQIADAFGAVDESVRRSIDGVSGLVTSLADAREALAALRKDSPTAGVGDLFGSLAGISSLVGIVGASAGIVSGLVGLFNRGPDPEVLAIQRKNNELLGDLNAQLAGYTNSLGTMTNTIARLSGVDLVSVARAARSFQFFGDDDVTRVFNQLIRETGLSLADLSRIAKDNGITILDEKGRLVADGFEHFAEILEKTRDVALRWGNTLEDLVNQRDLFREVHDIDPSSVTGMTRAVLDSADILKTIAPQLYDRILSGVDVSTASGRALFNDRLNAIVDEELSAEFQAGRGWLAELLKASGFENLADFNRWVLGADTALDAFAKSTREATDALGNVPAAFKSLVDLARFSAAAPGLPAAVPPTASPFTPGGVSPGGLLNGPAAAPVYHLGAGAIVVQAGERSAREIFDDVDAELKRRSRSEFGANGPGSQGLVYALYSPDWTRRRL